MRRALGSAAKCLIETQGTVETCGLSLSDRDRTKITQGNQLATGQAAVRLLSSYELDLVL